MNYGRIIRWGVLVAIIGLLLGAALAQVRGDDDPVKLTPTRLDQEFRASRKKTIEKYKGRTIELTGKVLRVTRHFSGQPEIDLEAGSEFIGLACYTVQKEPWGAFAKGQTVKITGKFPEFSSVASLEECVVETDTESPIRAVTAEALAKECEADPAGVNKAMNKRTLRVTGTVAASEFNAKTNFTNVTLTGAGKTQVACLLIPAEKDAGAALKVGQSATIVGEFGAVFENQVHLDSALVLTETK